MSVSPVGEGELVFVHPGNHGPLTAFDAKTGAVRWSAPDRAAYASPIIVELDGVRQVVTMTDNSVLGVSVPDGAPLWEHAWPLRGTPSAITPIQHGGTLIVSSQGTGIAALRPARRSGAWSVDVVWETAEVSLFLSNPVLVDNALFGLSEREASSSRSMPTPGGCSGSARLDRPRTPRSSNRDVFSSSSMTMRS
jgi:outer membrane protein assembly factor BamB